MSCTSPASLWLTFWPFHSYIVCWDFSEQLKRENTSHDWLAEMFGLRQAGMLLWKLSGFCFVSWLKAGLLGLIILHDIVELSRHSRDFFLYHDESFSTALNYFLLLDGFWRISNALMAKVEKIKYASYFLLICCFLKSIKIVIYIDH